MSTAEKFDLLDALWVELEAHAAALSPEQSIELDRRVETYKRDPSGVIPWENVKANLFKQ